MGMRNQSGYVQEGHKLYWTSVILARNKKKYQAYVSVPELVPGMLS